MRFLRLLPDHGCAALACVMLSLSALPTGALDSVDFRIVGGNEDLRKDLRDASTVVAAKREGRVAAEDILAAARAEYGRIVNAL